MADDEPNLLNPLELKTVSADDRGRAYLGAEYKDSKVKVAILEVQEDDE